MLTLEDISSVFRSELTRSRDRLAADICNFTLISFTEGCWHVRTTDSMTIMGLGLPRSIRIARFGSWKRSFRWKAADQFGRVAVSEEKWTCGYPSSLSSYTYIWTGPVAYRRTFKRQTSYKNMLWDQVSYSPGPRTGRVTLLLSSVCTSTVRTTRGHRCLASDAPINPVLISSTASGTKCQTQHSNLHLRESVSLLGLVLWDPVTLTSATSRKPPAKMAVPAVFFSFWLVPFLHLYCMRQNADR